MTPKLSILVAAYNEEDMVITALDSVPRRSDIEVLVRDDGSTDKTWDNLLRYRDEHPELNLKVFTNGNNIGVFRNVNKLLEDATGDYIHFLDGDDWLYTNEYNRAMGYIQGEDAIYIDLMINDGTVFRLNKDSRRGFCAPTTRFVRRKFAEGCRFKEDEKNAGDWYYNEEILARNPISVYTGICAYHYNHPRRGSIYDLLSRGLL